MLASNLTVWRASYRLTSDATEKKDLNQGEGGTHSPLVEDVELDKPITFHDTMVCQGQYKPSTVAGILTL